MIWALSVTHLCVDVAEKLPFVHLRADSPHAVSEQQLWLRHSCERRQNLIGQHTGQAESISTCTTMHKTSLQQATAGSAVQLWRPAIKKSRRPAISKPLFGPNLRTIPCICLRTLEPAGSVYMSSMNCTELIHKLILTQQQHPS